jgi:hypothetical protein
MHTDVSYLVGELFGLGCGEIYIDATYHQRGRRLGKFFGKLGHFHPVVAGECTHSLKVECRGEVSAAEVCDTA